MKFLLPFPTAQRLSPDGFAIPPSEGRPIEALF